MENLWSACSKGYMFSLTLSINSVAPRPGSSVRKYSCPSETFHGTGRPNQCGEINSNTIAYPEQMGYSEFWTHPYWLVCLVFLPTVSARTDQWSQRHQRAEGAQWCLGVHGRERCGCGWAASCHHKCWWPQAATTSLDCSVQPNGTPRMDYICSLWELQWIPDLRYHLIGGPEGLWWASSTPPSWQQARVSGFSGDLE